MKFRQHLNHSYFSDENRDGNQALSVGIFWLSLIVRSCCGGFLTQKSNKHQFGNVRLKNQPWLTSQDASPRSHACFISSVSSLPFPSSVPQSNVEPVSRFSGFRQQRQYIPSPLSSPAAARRFGQRLGDKICSSPIVCRVKKRIRDESSGDSKRNGFCGLLSSFREQETENLFILRTGDTGRIANRVHDDKWDVW